MSSVTKLVGAGSNDSSYGSTSWASPGNITAIDGVTTTALAGGATTTNYLKGLMTGNVFAIPGTDIIDGIEVTFYISSTGGVSEVFDRVRLVKGGTIGSTDRSTGAAIPTSLTAVSFGGPTDKWGTTWSASDVNDASFGAVLAITSPAAIDDQVDYVQITIYHRPFTDVVVPIYEYHARQRGESMWTLRQSTASQEVPIGPFVDAADGVTPMTGLTIANTDIKLTKTGSTARVSKNSGGASHDADGNYIAVFDATDSGTIGPMRISVYMSGALPVWLDCEVLDEAVYDVKYGTTAISTLGSNPQVDVTKWLGTTVATPPVAGVPTMNVKTWNNLTALALPLTPTVPGTTLDCSATGEAGVDWANVGGASTTVVLSNTSVNASVTLTTLPAAPTDWLTAAAVKADAVAKIGAGTVDLATSGHATSGTFGAAILAAAGGGSIDLGSILGTPLTETSAGYLTAGFKKLFDVAVPVFTAASVNQSGDSYPKVDTEIATLQAGVTTLLAASSGDIYICRYGGAFTSTAGTEVRVSVWLEKNGQAQVLASGTATVAFREHGAGSDLFSVTTSTVTADGIFELVQTTPGFTSDRLQIASITIDDGVNPPWITREPVPISG